MLLNDIVVTLFSVIFITLDAIVDAIIVELLILATKNNSGIHFFFPLSHSIHSFNDLKLALLLLVVVVVVVVVVVLRLSTLLLATLLRLGKRKVKLAALLLATLLRLLATLLLRLTTLRLTTLLLLRLLATLLLRLAALLLRLATLLLRLATLLRLCGNLLGLGLLLLLLIVVFVRGDRELTLLDLLEHLLVFTAAQFLVAETILIIFILIIRVQTGVARVQVLVGRRHVVANHINGKIAMNTILELNLKKFESTVSQ
jgi:hypothetical protein